MLSIDEAIEQFKYDAECKRFSKIKVLRGFLCETYVRLM